MHLSTDKLYEVFFADCPPFTLKSLEHRKITLHDASLPRFSTTLTMFSRTLQCIYLHVPNVAGLSPLGIGEVSGLTHFELVTESLTRRFVPSQHGELLGLVLWIEDSPKTLGELTLQTVTRLSSLTICLRLQGDIPNIDEIYSHSWRNIRDKGDQSLTWLSYTRTLCFFNHHRRIMRAISPPDAVQNHVPKLLPSFG